MTCNILRFLDASPMTLFDGTLSSRVSGDSSSDEVVESFISSVLSANDAIRQLACRVATRLFAEHPVLDILRGRGALSSEALRADVWRRR
jgi:neurofibromin 1